MPLYEFRCKVCGERFERLMRFGESSDELTCPVCEQGPVERLFSTFARSGGGGGGVACDPAPAGGG